jgi:signal transduction histidine kinase
MDTWYGYRRRVFLSDVPLLISLMEAVFIGLLCYFDTGPHSPFRFYYFLSLLVCAIRHAPQITYATYGLHTASYVALMVSGETLTSGDSLTNQLVLLVLMGWVTWASVALAGLIKTAERKLADLNVDLQQNQTLLELRIAERTQELQQSQALLVQQEKQAAFGLLAAGIAHEVGNPLASISSLMQLLNLRHGDEYTRSRLNMVDDQLRRIQRILGELVDFSRPANTEKTRCDVESVIESALSIAKYYKRKKGRRIATHYAQGLPKLRGLKDQWVQVFLNLILNALDATAEGGRVDITTSLQAGEIRVAVSDDGCGIPESARDQIFQPYYTTKPAGTGLGLFVCRHIMEQSGSGRIELTQSSPEGTTITVCFTNEEVLAHPDVEPVKPERIDPSPISVS